MSRERRWSELEVLNQFDHLLHAALSYSGTLKAQVKSKEIQTWMILLEMLMRGKIFQLIPTL